jgi:hypothetical protein
MRELIKHSYLKSLADVSMPIAAVTPLQGLVLANPGNVAALAIIPIVETEFARTDFSSEEPTGYGESFMEYINQVYPEGIAENYVIGLMMCNHTNLTQVNMLWTSDLNDSLLLRGSRLLFKAISESSPKAVVIPHQPHRKKKTEDVAEQICGELIESKGAWLEKWLLEYWDRLGSEALGL